MLSLLKELAILASGAGIGCALFDGVLHAILLTRTRDFFLDGGLLLTRLGHAIVYGILLWFVLIPAPVEAWATVQAWGFIAGLLINAVGLFVASGATQRRFVNIGRGT